MLVETLMSRPSIKLYQMLQDAVSGVVSANGSRLSPARVRRFSRWPGYIPPTFQVLSTILAVHFDDLRVQVV